MPKEDCLAEYSYFHSAAQATAHHFDQLNWVLNGLASAAILGLSPMAFSHLQFPPAVLDYSLLLMGIAFVALGYAWILIYKRHRFLVVTCYGVLHNLEAKIESIVRETDAVGASTVRLHLEIREKYPSTGRIKTGHVVAAMQYFAVSFGLFLITVGLLAALRV